MLYRILNIITLFFSLTFSTLSTAEINTTPVKVKFDTNLGDFTIELYPEKAPITVKNFLSYIDEGFYNDTIFHRVISNFMIQGGGFTKYFTEKKTKPPIKNESDNGLKNSEWTLAMARTQAADSATSQFFINTKDNAFLNYSKDKQGYAVFGKVIEGQSVINDIESKPTKNYSRHQDVPVEMIIIEKAYRL